MVYNTLHRKLKDQATQTWPHLKLGWTDATLRKAIGEIFSVHI